MPKDRLQIILAKPRGFCAGVVRAIEIVEQALKVHGAPVYVRHEIVHNKHVVEDLRRKGARFVQDVDEIPEGAVTVFSAHGVSRKVENDAETRQLDVIDATCPLVTKVHNQAKRFVRNGYAIVLIGHANHPEIEGTLGQIPGTAYLVEDVEDACTLSPDDPEKLAYVTQTTLSVDDTKSIIEKLKARFPKIQGPSTDDICYATQNRQTAVKALSSQVDVILVLGASFSSNSNRLREIGEISGIPSYLLDDASALNSAWLKGAKSVGITAGASAPEELVVELIKRLDELYDLTVSTIDGVDETLIFNLPRKLTKGSSQPAPQA